MNYQRSKTIYAIGMICYILAGFICIKFLYEQQNKYQLNETQGLEQVIEPSLSEFDILDKKEIVHSFEDVNSYSYSFDVGIYYELEESQLLNISDEIINDTKEKAKTENKTLSNIQINFLLDDEVFYQLSY